MYRDDLYSALIFIAGAVVGAVCGYYYAKKRYLEELCEEPWDPPTMNLNEDDFGAHDILRETQEPLSSNVSVSAQTKVYVIPPDEYASCGYDECEFSMFDDGIIADEFGEIVDTAELFPGIDVASRFGEYEDDSVYIRDEVRGLDFAIIRDYRTYEEMRKLLPPNIMELEKDAEKVWKR